MRQAKIAAAVTAESHSMIRIATFSSLVLACSLLPHNVRSEGTIEFNTYPYLSDVSSDSDLTINTAVSFPARFSYFSFMNFGGLFHSNSPNFQITEQNLRWKLTDHSSVDLAVQYVVRNGNDNDTIHAGVRWRLGDSERLKPFFDAINLDYSVQVFPKRLDERDVGGWQISHSYRLTFPYISDRLYFSGYIDHNIAERTSAGVERDSIISENQLGVRLFRQVYAVTEYRFNEYRNTSKGNVGLGIEVKVNW